MQGIHIEYKNSSQIINWNTIKAMVSHVKILHSEAMIYRYMYSYIYIYIYKLLSLLEGIEANLKWNELDA